jgi:hypothetical protein
METIDEWSAISNAIRDRITTRYDKLKRCKEIGIEYDFYENGIKELLTIWFELEKDLAKCYPDIIRIAEGLGVKTGL